MGSASTLKIMTNESCFFEENYILVTNEGRLTESDLAKGLLQKKKRIPLFDRAPYQGGTEDQEQAMREEFKKCQHGQTALPHFNPSLDTAP